MEGNSKLQDSDFNYIDYITYFISIISITFSFFLIYIIKHTKELNSNIANQFIILLTISEMINNITQFSSLFATWLENLNNMFDESLRVCFFQVYCNLFSNIMSLLSSLLISLHLYDAFFCNNSIFSTKKSVNIAKGITVYVSLILSLVFFIIQMEEFQNAEEIKYKRVISCWISGTLDYGLIAIYVIVIIVICILSYRVGKDVKAYRKELKASGEKNNVNDDRYDKVKLIHSVDSLRLAEQINQEAMKKNVDVDILIEVNIADETSKFGLNTEEVIDLIKKVSTLQNVHIKGLMTVAPFTDNPEENRPYFRNLKQLAVDINCKNIDNVTMSVLSMGMTGDYEIAIEEGATMVRVGTGIFGERIYTK